MANFKATSGQWEQLERSLVFNGSFQACVLELRYRVEALEANAKPTPNDRQIRSSLVERVQAAIGHSYSDDARAAIREVAVWLREQKAVDLPDNTQWAAARSAEMLEQEAERG